MEIGDLLSPERIACNVHATSKKRALELLSGLIAASEPGLTQTEVFESLIGRERLGSTGLGKGVAIPHGRLKSSDHAIGAFVKLDTGVDFDAMDNRPVDLLFALLVPEHFTDEHLQILARIAEMFSDPELCDRIRESCSVMRLFDLLSHWQIHRATA